MVGLASGRRFDKIDDCSTDAVTAPGPSLDDLKIDRDDDDEPRRWPWVVVAILLLGAVGAWFWRNAPAGAAEVRIVEAQESVAAPDDTAVLNASGYVTARRRATVSSKITGKLVEVLVEEGMAVRQGQVLARLDDSTIRSQLALAQARLAASERGFAEQEVRLREAQLTLGRTRRLVDEGVMSPADLDGDLAEVDSLEARIALAREQVTVAEREIGVLETQLDDTIIRAPFTGVAISKDAEEGEMISPVSAGGGFTRTGISTIVDMDSLEIEVDVSESYINRVLDEQRVVANLDAYPDWDIPAAVITTVPAADRQRATVLVRIAFDALDPRILPDMGVQVAFLEEQEAPEPSTEPRLLMPSAAARDESGQAIVFVLQGDTVERRAVRLGATVGNQVEVLAGVNVGERLVVGGPPELADGDPVVVVE
ncbi:MAG: efflux transporter periplasmic adaptor subunit [Acidimicrobiaceae bacterium]|nr:efflux transporter periplasmic adaptor subunit [Acidimicrobiaceae bacterium]